MNHRCHGTAVAIESRAVLLTGPSGAGKSDLALRLIDRGARLVGDDHVDIYEEAGQPWIKAAASLAGKLEIRGLGIVECPFTAQSPLHLLVELGEDGERHPASWPLRDFGGWSLPAIRLNGFAASAPLKVEYAVKSVIDAALLPVRLSHGL